MTEKTNVRVGWLKFMYAYTIVGAGTTGLGILLIPETMKSVFGIPPTDPVVIGLWGSVFVAFAILSIFGLRAPIKYIPVLMLQFCYKSVWFLAVVLPLLIKNEFPAYAVTLAMIFVTYIIGDIIAIPLPFVLSREATP